MGFFMSEYNLSISHANLNYAALASLRHEAETTNTLSRQPLLEEFAAPMGPTTFDMAAETRKIYKFIVGSDHGKPKQMTEGESAEYLNDSFAGLVLKQGKFPLTANGILQALQETTNQAHSLE